MNGKLPALLAAAMPSLARATHSADPAGPSEWTVRNWAGLCVQVALFALALGGLWRLAGRGRD